MTVAAIDRPNRLGLPEDRPSSLIAWAEQAEAAAGIAKALVPTAFCPDTLKIRDRAGGLDFDASVAQVAAALLTGQELGLEPMAALRSIDVIPPGSGQPAIRAVALRALVQAAGHEIWVAESTETRAVVRGRRRGTAGPPQESIWTIDRARKLRLRGFGPDGHYQRQPTSMLVARATGECARWIAADVILGLPYVAEEIETDPEGEAAAPAPAGDDTAAPARKTARRRTPAAKATGAGAGSPMPGMSSPPAGEAGPPPPETITASQRARLWSGLKRLGLSAKEDALPALSAWIGRDLPRTSELTAEEAGRAIAAIDAEEARRAAAASDSADDSGDGGGDAPDAAEEARDDDTQ